LLSIDTYIPRTVMQRYLLLSALAFARAVSLRVGTVAECSHDREAAFRSIQDRSGSLWMFHVTHNAGTSIGHLITQHLTRGRSTAEHGLTFEKGSYYSDEIIGEYGFGPRPLNEQVPCDSNRFVSIFPVRNPLPRILTADGAWTTTSTGHTEDCNTDNYGLRKLVGKSFHDPINRTDIEFAKRRLESFDIVMDVAALKESAGAMCRALGFSACTLPQINKGSGLLSPGQQSAASEEDVLEKVGPDLFAKWKERNAPELEVYRYAQKLSADFVARYPGAPAAQGPVWEYDANHQVIPSSLVDVQGSARARLARQGWLCGEPPQR